MRSFSEHGEGVFAIYVGPSPFGNGWSRIFGSPYCGMDMRAPETLEEARKYTYGRWSKKPDYRKGDCIWEVFSRGGFGGSYQCTRKDGHGPDKLYCKQHAKMVEK